ncbi:cysteine proteinase [Plenodomus tracheiphilus IPT5]|uniref:ubiquitinyl hydrolase 1 n=1 Tax=Plenodomus tracheiphilus IPT5 TaxID=1408161 RepID=A0A6A7BIF9_9PLEO|nr:cysteine proteinase [Plenodomus tracheiphilus IPT5]
MSLFVFQVFRYHLYILPHGGHVCQTFPILIVSPCIPYSAISHHNSNLYTMVASNVSHRAGVTNERYHFRAGGAPAIPAHYTAIRSHTPRQIQSNRIAKGVKKSWPTGRAQGQTRGLHRVGNTCFRVSALQALMHLPKFCNWILSHNSKDNNFKFPCRGLGEVGTFLANRYISYGANPVVLRECPACAVKQFIIEYWGATQCTDAGNNPTAFGHYGPEQQRIRDLDERLYRITSGAVTAGNRDMQQDPAECQERLLHACFASTDHDDWRVQYKALFEMQKANFPPTIGIQAVPVPPQPEAPSSVDKSIQQHIFTDELIGMLDCAVCNQETLQNQRTRLDVAPALLRVSLVTQTMVNGQSVKNTNPIEIPRFLDLTQHQAVQDPKKLEYQLESVLSHAGEEASSGHWVATVNSKTMIYAVNDGETEMRCVVVNKNKKREIAALRSNPQFMQPDVIANAVYLTYSRREPKRPLL